MSRLDSRFKLNVDFQILIHIFQIAFSHCKFAGDFVEKRPMIESGVDVFRVDGGRGKDYGVVASAVQCEKRQLPSVVCGDFFSKPIFHVFIRNDFAAVMKVESDERSTARGCKNK